MRMGFSMRQQAISAIFAKTLRLNSSAIADISAGKVKDWNYANLCHTQTDVVSPCSPFRATCVNCTSVCGGHEGD